MRREGGRGGEKAEREKERAQQKRRGGEWLESSHSWVTRERQGHIMFGRDTTDEGWELDKGHARRLYQRHALYTSINQSLTALLLKPLRSIIHNKSNIQPPRYAKHAHGGFPPFPPASQTPLK